MKKVTILLSTFNGEKFLPELLDSLFRQEDVEVFLLARDDGSTDNTLNILSEYSNQYTNMKWFVGENIGPSQSFFELIENSDESDYYALCDQDDVWDTDKMKCAIELLENENSRIPLLYYSNLRIVDEKLEYCRLSHQKPRINSNRYSCLLEGLMTGCTGVFNNSTCHMLKKRFPKSCSMHDAWIYMVCIFFGKVIYDFEPHISYRQHENNVIGTYKTTFNTAAIKKRIKRLFNRNLQPKYNNAKSFLKSYQDILSVEDIEKILLITKYKCSLKDWLKLLFNTEIHTTSLSRELRYRVLIILRII